MPGINLTDDDMRGLLAGVISSNLTSDQRDKLITDAIKGLLEAQKDSYGRAEKPSKLAEIFGNAVYLWANIACKEYITNNKEIQDQITSIIADGYKKALIDNRDQTVEAVAQAISKSLDCHGKNY